MVTERKNFLDLSVQVPRLLLERTTVVKGQNHGVSNKTDATGTKNK